MKTKKTQGKGKVVEMNTINRDVVVQRVSAIEYNPFLHRQVENPSSDLRALANLLKASLGSGILAMPLAFSNSGWLVGIIGTAIIAFLCGHCVHIFVKTSQQLCKLTKTPSLGYAATCKMAFITGPGCFKNLAKCAYIFSEIALISTYLGVCCIFTVLIGDSIKQVFDKFVLHRDPPVEYYCLVIIIPLCFMVQIRHLKWLAPFSAMANILLIATFIICLYYIFGDTIDINDKKAYGDWKRFPAYLSTVIFAMEGIGVVMPVENGMKNPHHFLGCPGILGIAMSILSVLYVLLGLFGYLRFGDNLRGSITLNLPIDHWPAVCAKIFIATSIFLTYPLHFYVVADTLNRFMEPYINKKYEHLIQIFMRIAIVLFCGGIGIAIPMLEEIINIVGALFYSLLGIVIPGVVETVFMWNHLGRCKWILWKNIFIVSFGLTCLVSGCIVTVMDIIKKYHRTYYTSPSSPKLSNLMLVLWVPDNG